MLAAQHVVLRSIAGRELAKRLREIGVRTRNVTVAGVQAKGYRLADVTAALHGAGGDDG